jgi:MFS superfamily sulfate permease-like transporter
MHHYPSMFSHWKEDSIAGTVVFLVALPLCLGIAVACGVPPVSGLVAGICGGLIVPWISRSALSVTGPAAGLTAIVITEIASLGGLAPFLTAVIIAGGIQTTMGALRLGQFAALVPSAVIKGMLAAIGATIIWVQLPVALGVTGGLTNLADGVHPGSVAIAVMAFVILYGWKASPLSRLKFASPALVVVLVTSGLAYWFRNLPAFALTQSQFVRVPLGGPVSLFQSLPRPDFGAFMDPAVWVVALTLAIVASIETLLSVQAVDRLDPLKRQSPPDRELMAQGAANAVSGLLGGLPVTAVIVRSGANVAAGAVERLSTLVHGVLLLVSVVAAGALLNMIPLAALAAVLIQVGLNLCKPALFAAQARLGWSQLLPFAITVGAVLALDLLKGVIVGIVGGIVFVLYENARRTVVAERNGDGTLRMLFLRDATFVSKPTIASALAEVDGGETVVIDGTGEYVDHDVKELLATFIEDAQHRNIKVTLAGIDLGHARAGGGH